MKKGTQVSVSTRFHSDTITAIDVGLVDFLATMMGAINAQMAIILSAYRKLETNPALARTTFGVAENSQHLYGRALDVRFESRLREAMLAARAIRRGGVGWYERSRFIHIDTGPVRNWELGDAGLDTMLICRNNPTGTRIIEPLDRFGSGQIKPNLNQSGRHLRELDLSGNISAELNNRGRFVLDPARRK